MKILNIPYYMTFHIREIFDIEADFANLLVLCHPSLVTGVCNLSLAMNQIESD